MSGIRANDSRLMGLDPKDGENLAEDLGIPAIDKWVGGQARALILVGIPKAHGTITEEHAWKAEIQVKNRQFRDKCKGTRRGKEGRAA